MRREKVAVDPAAAEHLFEGRRPGGTRHEMRIGAYLIESTLGQGGMGEVFLAWDERLRRHVAIKRVLDDKSLDREHRLRLLREARAVARLNHPSIVQIFDILEQEDGDCIVMEYVEGSALSRLLGRGPLDLRRALEIACDVADGLAEAHDKGLVHRDLKTGNVVVSPSGRAKILDFGLVRPLWEDDFTGGNRGDTLTATGALVGTVQAMSPEQAAGRPIDHRADLFAFGTLLYEMLTGKAPFRGENVFHTLRRVTSEMPPPVSELRPQVPPAVSDLIAALLAKEPDDRPPNARVVGAELRRALHETASGNDGAPARLDHRALGELTEELGLLDEVAHRSLEVFGDAGHLDDETAARRARTLVDVGDVLCDQGDTRAALAAYRAAEAVLGNVSEARGELARVRRRIADVL